MFWAPQQERRNMRVSSSLELPTTYVSYDLETTGLSSSSSIIEIGAVRVIDCYEDEKFDTLVALGPGEHVDPGARRVNHISDDMLAGAPSLTTAYHAFVEFVGDLPLVGQNIKAFDNHYIDAAAQRTGEPRLTQNGSYDTMLLYRSYVGRPANLASICQHYGVENERAHRAWADAQATSDCYLAILRDLASRRVDLNRLLAMPTTGELARETICFTGNSYEYPKLVCQTIAQHHGAHVVKRTTTRTTLVVKLEAIDSINVKRAREFGCAVITGEEFLERLGLSADDLRK